MAAKDPRIDAYIGKAADFAKPILKHLRKTVHAGCPDVEETIKWGFPHFMREGILCSMAAFKGHCTFGFWRGGLLAEKHKGLAKTEDAHGQFGRITALSDLPPEKTLLRYIKDAAALNERGVKPRSKPKAAAKPALEVPAYLLEALRKNKKALSAFESFSPSHKREYVEWITGAKGEETRRRRLEQAVAMMAEGKSRHWKYQKKS